MLSTLYPISMYLSMLCHDHDYYIDKGYEVDNIKSMGLYLGIDTLVFNPIYMQFVFVFSFELGSFRRSIIFEIVLVHSRSDQSHDWSFMTYLVTQ